MRIALPVALSVLGAFAFAAPAPAPVGVPCDISLDFTKDSYLPGEIAVLNITNSGNPNSLIWLGFDSDPGPTLLPGIGEVCWGFSSAFLYTEPPLVLPGDSQLQWSCENPCINPITGTPIYIQAVALDPDSLSICVSNCEVLNVEDSDGLCTGEGCTPGYWKNHHEDWVGYAPGDDWDTVFGVDYHNPDQTLDEALDTALGDWTFAAHAVAALLNASSPDVDYPYTEGEVIALVQAAAMGTLLDQESQKNIFEVANESNCPL